MICPVCQGARTVRCGRCEGQGYVLDVDGARTCLSCLGHGFLGCRTCEGKGRLDA